jgi:tRNA-splicing ligase RtcB
MHVIYDGEMKVPAKIWSGEGTIEEGALQQIRNAGSLPFAFHHVAMMPDGHYGYGAPIGGVLATKGAVVPNFVGLDVGCGLCAVKTPWSIGDIDLIKLQARIREDIPVGFSHRVSSYAAGAFMPKPSDYDAAPNNVIMMEYESSKLQLGSLGSGNHFLEIQKDDSGYLWIMIHSGSRNLGKKVADYYDKRAKYHNAKWHSAVPKAWDLAFLPIDTDDAKMYLREMNYCVAFALANRLAMMEITCSLMEDIVRYKKVDRTGIINIAHNYAKFENHFGENVIVHRKGATLAREGTIGIIPGSMGTASYIVEGLGNPQSFMSCSHGAGRKMGRSQAKKNLNLEAEMKILDDQGIVHGMKTVEDLDEASGSYKDIDSVMVNQMDLVKVVTKLRPLMVVKG